MNCPSCKLELASHNFQNCTHCRVSYCTACIVPHVKKVMFDYVQIPQAVKALGKPQ